MWGSGTFEPQRIIRSHIVMKSVYQVLYIPYLNARWTYFSLVLIPVVTVCIYYSEVYYNEWLTSRVGTVVCPSFVVEVKVVNTIIELQKSLYLHKNYSKHSFLIGIIHLAFWDYPYYSVICLLGEGNRWLSFHLIFRAAVYSRWSWIFKWIRRKERRRGHRADWQSDRGTIVFR